VIRLPRGGTSAQSGRQGCLDREAGVHHELALSLDTVFNIGAADGTPLDDKDYQIPFKFEGTISKVTCPLDRPKLAPEDVKRLEAGNRVCKAQANRQHIVHQWPRGVRGLGLSGTFHRVRIKLRCFRGVHQAWFVTALRGADTPGKCGTNGLR
jgi:hypothetical protein